MKQKTRLLGGFFEIREKIEEKLCDRTAELLWSAQAGRACDEESEKVFFCKDFPNGGDLQAVRSTLAGFAEKRKVARLTAPERAQSKRSEKPPLQWKYKIFARNNNRSFFCLLCKPCLCRYLNILLHFT